MPRRYDAVIFDWYATLAAPSGSDWWQEMLAMLERAGAVIPSEALDSWTTPPIEHPKASVDEASYHRYEREQLGALLASSGLGEATERELLEEIIARRDEDLVGIFPDVIDLLDELHKEGVAVALCSNWGWDLTRHLEHNGLTERFDAVVCSALVGYRKPHPVIFEVVLAELDVPASRTAFIGDDWRADVVGAREAGIAPIHLARELCVVEDHLDVPCAGGLEDLRPILFSA